MTEELRERFDYIQKYLEYLKQDLKRAHDSKNTNHIVGFNKVNTIIRLLQELEESVDSELNLNKEDVKDETLAL